MGIKNLMQLVKECEDVLVSIDTAQLEGKIVAVDSSIYVYKYLPSYLNDFYSCVDDSVVLDNEKRSEYEKQNEETICEGVSRKIMQLFDYLKSQRNIQFVFLLDGEKPDLKLENACSERKISKDKMRDKLQEYIQKKDVESVRKNLTYTYKLPSTFSDIFIRVVQEHGYEYVTAVGEAETYACTLMKQGKVHYILTTDTDCLAMGCDIITRIDVHQFLIVRYGQLLKETGLTQEQFLDFCILCGCDYNQKLPGIGVKRALNLIKTHKSIENIGKNTKYKVECLNAEQCRQLFTV